MPNDADSAPAVRPADEHEEMADRIERHIERLGHTFACRAAFDELLDALADLPASERRDGDAVFRCSCRDEPTKSLLRDVAQLLRAVPVAVPPPPAAAEGTDGGLRERRLREIADEGEDAALLERLRVLADAMTHAVDNTCYACGAALAVSRDAGCTFLNCAYRPSERHPEYPNWHRRQVRLDEVCRWLRNVAVGNQGETDQRAVERVVEALRVWVVIVDRGISAVIDVSQFESDAEVKATVADFRVGASVSRIAFDVHDDAPTPFYPGVPVAVRVLQSPAPAPEEPER